MSTPEAKPVSHSRTQQERKSKTERISIRIQTGGIEQNRDHHRSDAGATIYDAAYGVKDFRTMQFLDWFVKEQGEEEKNAEDLIKKMELFGSDPKGLYMLDQELAARVYAAPSLVL